MLLLLFSAAADNSIPGKAYRKLMGLYETPVHPYQAAGLASIVLCLLILIARTRSWTQAPPAHLEGPASVPCRLPMLVWFAAAAVSFISHPALPETMVSFFGIYISSILAYVALSDLEVDARYFRALIWALGLGSLLPFVLGLKAFTSTLGTPTLLSLLAARMHSSLLEGYEAETFGNTTNMASFIVLIYPGMLIQMLDRRQPPALRGLCGLVSVASLVHLLLIQSRAGIITIALTTVLIVLLFRRANPRTAFGLLALLSGLALVVTWLAWDTFSERLLLAATASQEDASVYERRDAIAIGTRFLLENPWTGIGPGFTLLDHPYRACHQINLQHGCELGMLGFATSVWLCAAMLPYLTWPLQCRTAPSHLMRFTLLSGPLVYLLYVILAGGAQSMGWVNTWSVLFHGLLALGESSRFALPSPGRPQRASLGGRGRQGAPEVGSLLSQLQGHHRKDEACEPSQHDLEGR